MISIMYVSFNVRRDISVRNLGVAMCRANKLTQSTHRAVIKTIQTRFDPDYSIILTYNDT